MSQSELPDDFAASLTRVLDPARSEEHTSELQSHSNLVCRLLLEKKKKTTPTNQAREAARIWSYELGTVAMRAMISNDRCDVRSYADTSQHVLQEIQPERTTLTI